MTTTDPRGRRPGGEAVEAEPKHRVGVGLALAGAMAAALVAALVGIPREHAALPAVAREALEVALPGWKLTEPVNEVVYGTRGFDTFGETFLLLAAVMSVVVLARPREPRRRVLRRGRPPGRASRPRSTASASDAGQQDAREAENSRGRASPGEGRAPRGRRRPLTPSRWAQPAPERAEAMTRRGARRPCGSRRRCWRWPACTWPPGGTPPAADSRPARCWLGVVDARSTRPSAGARCARCCVRA